MSDLNENKKNEDSSDNSSESDRSPKTPVVENSTKHNVRTRVRKRKRLESSSSEDDSILAENALQMEKNLHASAIKNNLDDVSVKKILKKVVTNDHVLALVKLREEEESSMEEKIRPKLTRAKVKELMKDLPNSTHGMKDLPTSLEGWNLENLELTPIKHIPVKTRPEVKALIAQELPDDEDDDEYKPTHDDVPSDDDHTVESISDVDSLPRTPSTPKSQSIVSPQVVQDGPFKVPQSRLTPTRRKLNLEEEATIALRTRSKLSLSSTSIEHIESSFIPPDDVPTLDVDDPVWNEFLEECLNPASTTLVAKEDDDDADPEYNVAADPDIHDDDEEALENSIIKISKKELNDLVTELFSIMPEVPAEDKLEEDLANKVNTGKHSENSLWNGKQVPQSDGTPANIGNIDPCFSIGKREPEDTTGIVEVLKNEKTKQVNTENQQTVETNQTSTKNTANETQTSSQQWNGTQVTIIGEQVSVATVIPTSNIMVVVEEAEPPKSDSPPPQPPEVLQVMQTDQPLVLVQLSQEPSVLPEQVLILQQQIRQHVQLATSNFLQLFTHPTYWSYAPKYKEYLTTLSSMATANTNSVVNVCNLGPAVELVTTWEKTVSEVTPENTAMVKHIQKEVQRSRSRSAACSLYLGDFHDTLKDVVANSPVFLYPYLLPPMMYRPDSLKRFKFLPPEDELIALGLDEFWSYVEDNPKLYPLRSMRGGRAGLKAAVRLLCRYMLSWLAPHTLLQHVRYVRRNDKENPIYKFFESRKVQPVKHKLLPYNPKITLYEQPEYEMPRIWLRHLAKTSKRFRDYLYRRNNVNGVQPSGVDVVLGDQTTPQPKKPLPNDFTKVGTKPITYITTATDEILDDQINIEITASNTLHDITPVNNASDGTTTVNSTSQPICSTSETYSSNDLINKSAQNNTDSNQVENNKENNECKKIINNKNDVTDASEAKRIVQNGHCTCCVLVRKICKQRQTLITDYMKCKYKVQVKCPCKSIQRPRITNKLRMLLKFFKHRSMYIHQDMTQKLLECNQNGFDNENNTNNIFEIDDIADPQDLAFATSLEMKILVRLSVTRNVYTKKSVYQHMSKFDQETDDPVKLAMNLEKAFDVELVDLFKEFLRCLTAEQAAQINRFKDYFTQACAPELVKKISEEVKDKSKRHALLSRLILSFTDNKASACDVCSDLLAHMEGHADLARYTFNLFPHLKHDSCTSTSESEPVPTVTTRSKSKAAEKQKVPSLVRKVSCTKTPRRQIKQEETETMDCEDIGPGDHKSDNDDIKEIEEEKKEMSESEIEEEKYLPNEDHIEKELSQADDKLDMNNIKIEVIMSDEDTVKSESQEWQRSEDRLILEVLKQSFTREERKNKTILDIIEEMDVLQIITDSLPHKSVKDVADRVMYLLDLLVLSEN